MTLNVDQPTATENTPRRSLWSQYDPPSEIMFWGCQSAATSGSFVVLSVLKMLGARLPKDNQRRSITRLLQGVQQGLDTVAVLIPSCQVVMKSKVPDQYIGVQEWPDILLELRRRRLSQTILKDDSDVKHIASGSRRGQKRCVGTGDIPWRLPPW